LAEHFQPEQLIGVDVDQRLVRKAETQAAKLHRDVRVSQGSVTDLNLPDQSVDVVFCHQLLHHVAEQDRTLRELYRILAPGGLLLVSESCKPFITSWAVRWFFRHPMHVQKTSQEYQVLLRANGFEFSAADIGESVPWWSLPDFGIARRLGWSRGPFDTTELLVVATKRDCR
jgi:ubiquinone/menaquinone biosynthesis C-methylase UbiE